MTGASADIVVGLGWGDEGKGVTTDRLTHLHDGARVVRFNGGHQAAHNVAASGHRHTFSSYGSGTFAGAPTYVSGDCVVNPVSAATEAEALQHIGVAESLLTLTVHEDALVAHDYHTLVNRAKERQRGDARHGSVGVGFGEVVGWDYHGHRALRAADLADHDLAFALLEEYVTFHAELDLIPDELADKTHILDVLDRTTRAARHMRVIPDTTFLDELSTGHTVFEGAQGFMLDENFGQAPWTTWSTTTPANARRICRALGITPEVHGVIRTYATRHGAGPFPGEGGVDAIEPDNAASEFQGPFRTGLHTTDLMQWALDIVTPDHMAITWADRFNTFQTTDGPLDFDALGVPVSIIGRGPERHDMDVR